MSRKLNSRVVSLCVLSISDVRMCSTFSTAVPKADKVCNVSWVVLRAKIDFKIRSAAIRSLPELVSFWSKCAAGSSLFRVTSVNSSCMICSVSDIFIKPLKDI